MFLSGDLERIEKLLKARPDLETRIRPLIVANTAAQPEAIPGITDDWPYLYHARKSIPPMYLLLNLMLVLLFIFAVWRAHALSNFLGWDKTASHFFFLGAAFLLLEVHNVSWAALVLGNTWLVNAVVISGILIMALAANFIVPYLNSGAGKWLGTALLVSCAALYFSDITVLNSLPYGWRATLLGVWLGVPMLFSGLVFSSAFAGCTRRDLALGANLLGALCGALLQVLSFIFGLHSLIIAAFILYLAAVASGPSRVKPQAASK